MDVLGSIFLLLAGIAIIIFVRFYFSAAHLGDINGSGAIPFFLILMSCMYVFFALESLVTVFPHYRQLTALLEKDFFEEIVLTIEPIKTLDGEIEYHGKPAFSDERNVSHDFCVIVRSAKLRTIAKNRKVKVYYDKSRRGKGPIIIEADKEFFCPSVRSSEYYVL